MSRWILSGVVWAVFALSPVMAQEDGFIEFTPTQRELNESGVKAAIDGDFRTAVSMFESSNALGENNITYLNLGRAYHKLGRCNKAKESYDSVTKAPKVQTPTPVEIALLLTKYVDDLVNCVETEIVKKDPDPIKPPDKDPTFAIVGWSSLGVGAALLVTALIIETGVLSSKFDEQSTLKRAGGQGSSEYQALGEDIDTLQTVNLGLLITGGVLAVTGVTFILIDLLADDDDPTGNSQIQPWLSTQSAGVLYQLRW